MHATFQLLYETKDYSDAIVRCGSEAIAVHRAVICPRSTYFEKAFGGCFAEASSREINLGEETSDVVIHCLEYLYLDTYKHSVTTGLILHAQLYAAGDKYGIPGLLVLARKRFGEAMKTSPEWLEANIKEVIQQIYATAVPSADDLRADLVEHLQRRLPNLLSSSQFLELLQTVDGLAADLLEAQLVPELPEPRDCNSKFCKGRMSMHWIPACDGCGLNVNLTSR